VTRKNMDKTKPLDQRLKGYMVSTIVEWLRNQKKVYRDLTEAEQRDVIGNISEACGHLIIEATSEIASKNYPTVRGTLESLGIKSDVKAQIKLLGGTDTISVLAPRTNQTVMIVCADPTAFFGGDMPVPQKDQGDIEQQAEGAAG